MSIDPVQFTLIATFIIGYALIVFEHVVNVNKAATALIVAVISWGVVIASGGIHTLDAHLSDISQIILFLLGAMITVELIDAHQGFSLITRFIRTRSTLKLMWMLSLLTFFLSAILDNLTTAIVMLSLLRKLLKERHDRWIFGALIVIAANAGGAWTPIGDVTTTMLWINGQITTTVVMKALFIPSLVSLIVSLVYQSIAYRGKKVELIPQEGQEKPKPYGKAILFLGITALISVPLLKIVFHVPPFMGILMGMSIIWAVTDLVHYKFDERGDLRLPAVLRRVDISSVLFFLGILLSISALSSAGTLENFATWLDRVVPSKEIIAAFVGLSSALIDNVPLVAACMGMYDLQTYAQDSSLWQMIAYCAGTGGSILIIGSAAGVAFMGIEKVNFFWYLRNVSLTAALGYFAGFGTYLLFN